MQRVLLKPASSAFPWYLLGTRHKSDMTAVADVGQGDFGSKSTASLPVPGREKRKEKIK